MCDWLDITHARVCIEDRDLMHRHDPTQVFTLGRIPALEVRDYEWCYPLQDNGIGLTWTQWLRDNCESAWGWWFDDRSMCYVGFVDKQEMMRFVMVYRHG